ncbi:nitrile hydratase subunit beta [Acidobacteria bacterium AH-259-D05]|nr:nitrile hydratase subunit beta [Acidobacteria bacterium AH-259-D05]
MNGIHDMGGMDGFGKVQPQDSEAFHELWEKQIYVANRLVRTESLNAGRSADSMNPVDYLSWGYFGRSLHSLEGRVLRNGLVTEEELRNPEGRLARVDGYQAVRAEEVEARFQTRRGSRIQVDVPPRFQVGDRVMVKNEHPRGHTRCPRYFRGRQGQVHRDRGVWPFPDTVALGLGPKPQHCYSVRFAATELWGSRADPKDVVYADLFDDYLEAAS